MLCWALGRMCKQRVIHVPGWQEEARPEIEARDGAALPRPRSLGEALHGYHSDGEAGVAHDLET